MSGITSLTGLVFNSVSTHADCAALSAAALAVDVVSVVADLGCGLVVSMTPCKGLSIGCASFADLVIFTGISGLTGLTGFLGLSFNSDSIHDNCVVLPAVELAVKVVMPITLSLCMVPNMFMSGTISGHLTRHRKMPNPM